RGIHLPAAAITTDTFCSVCFNGQMSYFTGKPCVTIKYFMVDDNTTSDTVSYTDKNSICRLLRITELLFADNSRACFIIYLYWNIKIFLEHLCLGNIAPWKGGGN